jgi:hypothetical protein
LFLRPGSHDPLLLNSYGPLKLSLWHLDTLEALLEMIFRLQQTPFTILLGVALSAFCIGCFYYWRHNRLAFSFLLTPLLFALLASCLHLYPAVGRFYLFFAPALALLIAAGMEALMQAAAAIRLPLAAVLVALLFLEPALTACQIIAHPMQAEELRPVLAYVQAHQQPGDVWYIYWHTQIAYRYYAEAYGLRGSNVVIGSCRDCAPRAGVFEQDAARLRGRRVWVLIANPSTATGDEFTMLVRGFDAAGVRRDVFWQPGAVAFLYQL